MATSTYPRAPVFGWVCDRLIHRRALRQVRDEHNRRRPGPVGEKSQGNALCVGVAPQYFDVDDDGVVVVLRRELPHTDQALVEEAAKVCPVAALRISDAAGYISTSDRQ